MTLFASQLSGSGQNTRPPVSRYTSASTYVRHGFYYLDLQTPSPITGYSTPINITAKKGFISLLGVVRKTAQSPTGTTNLRLTIDNGTPMVFSAVLDDESGLFAVGSLYSVSGTEYTVVTPSFESVPFESSLKVEVQNTASITAGIYFDLVHKIWITEE